jgi:hypothetical protein
VRDKLVGRMLKEKCLSSSVRNMVKDIEDFQEIWYTLDTCFDQAEKYIAEALVPIIKFRKYRVFDNGAV